MKTPSLPVAVVGGGASGLMAAIAAARDGAAVVLLERQDRVGKKILATGNGRCNLTNIHGGPGHYYGRHPDFVRPALEQFPVPQTLEFFHHLGVCTVVEEEGRVYPLTGQASTILDVLRAEAARLGVEVRTQAEVQSIVIRDREFVLRWPPGGELRAGRVIVAGGGRAMPQLGGTDQGMKLLEQLGHPAGPSYPVLVPLKTGGRPHRQLKGVKLNGRVQLFIAGEAAAAETGEVLFTEYGLSGPPLIQLSLAANQALHRKQDVSLALDCFPEWSAPQLTKQLADRRQNQPEAPLEENLIGLIHKRLIPAVLQEAELDPRTPAGRVTAAASGRLGRVLKNWTFPVTGSLSWSEAHVMAGGIDTAGFTSRTLESKTVPGLYACGEVLDVCGDCGGYNLQWAWSSGWVAGRGDGARQGNGKD